MIVGPEIAQGAYAYVYKAHDATNGDVFALKKILCQTEEQSALAKQEIQTHKALEHPHLMPLMDYAVVTLEAHVQEFYLLFPYMEVSSRVMEMTAKSMWTLTGWVVC